MGIRIVTTDVEIIDAAIKEFMPLRTFPLPVTEEDVNEAARRVAQVLKAPPQKTSDITGFEEDDE